MAPSDSNASEWSSVSRIRPDGPRRALFHIREFVIPADQIVKAIGQVKLPVAAALGLQTDKGYIRVNSNYETSLSGVYAGGDCIRSKGAASTVMAVQDGKLAALAIHSRFLNRESEVGVTTHG